MVEVLRLCGVHEWEPHTVAPCEIETKVIMCNINSAKIPIFMPEKVDDVDRVQK